MSAGAFYEAIGFEMRYRQKAPNVFAVVRRGPIELQFFTMKGYEPANSYSTCYVLTAAVDRLYADFRDGLERALGRVPSRGIPRIGALNDMSYGMCHCVITDPGGNMIRHRSADHDRGGAAGDAEHDALRAGWPACLSN